LPYNETHTSQEAFLHERGYHTRASLQQLGTEGKEGWDARAANNDLETKPEVGACAKTTSSAKLNKADARARARERNAPDMHTKAKKQFAKRRAKEEVKRAKLQAQLAAQLAAMDALAQEEDAAMAKADADEDAKLRKRSQKEVAAQEAVAKRAGAAAKAGYSSSGTSSSLRGLSGEVVDVGPGAGTGF
jgi:hypothetical protein